MDLTPHTLGEYCALLEPQLAAPLPEGLDLSQSVALVSCDSQEVVPGTLFLCKGAHFKEAYLSQAAQRGAVAYVSQTPTPAVDLPCILVSDMRQVMAPWPTGTTAIPPGSCRSSASPAPRASPPPPTI